MLHTAYPGYKYFRRYENGPRNATRNKVREWPGINLIMVQLAFSWPCTGLQLRWGGISRLMGNWISESPMGRYDIENESVYRSCTLSEWYIPCNTCAQHTLGPYVLKDRMSIGWTNWVTILERNCTLKSCHLSAGFIRGHNAMVRFLGFTGGLTGRYVHHLPLLSTYRHESTEFRCWGGRKQTRFSVIVNRVH